MPVYVVTYDLTQSRQHYQRLWPALIALRARHVLSSTWAVEADGPATALRDYLRQFVDLNDRVLVMELESADWAEWNLTTRLGRQ